jgi:hypothetical protein
MLPCIAADAIQKLQELKPSVEEVSSPGRGCQAFPERMLLALCMLCVPAARMRSRTEPSHPARAIASSPPQALRKELVKRDAARSAQDGAVTRRDQALAGVRNKQQQLEAAKVHGRAGACMLQGGVHAVLMEPHGSWQQHVAPMQHLHAAGRGLDARAGLRPCTV